MGPRLHISDNEQFNHTTWKVIRTTRFVISPLKFTQETVTVCTCLDCARTTYLRTSESIRALGEHAYAVAVALNAPGGTASIAGALTLGSNLKKVYGQIKSNVRTNSLTIGVGVRTLYV